MRVHIRRELIRRIADGTCGPGHRLVELTIAREFNTSQAPVREALRELEAMRLVESETYRGTRVRAISPREEWEAAVVRGVLEAAAARDAAAVLRHDARALREQLQALREAARAGDLDGYASHNMAFHRVIVQAAGNEVMLRVWDTLLLEARTRLNLARNPLDLNEVAAAHEPIVEALEAGDGVLAGRLLQEHAEAVLRVQAPAPTARAADTPPLAV